MEAAADPGRRSPLPHPRGPISAVVRECLEHARPLPDEPPLSADRRPSEDGDFQLALWMLYELHYGGLSGVDDALEWSPELLGLRARLEAAFEADLRVLVPGNGVPSTPSDLVAALRERTAADGMPPLARHLQREGDEQQLREFLMVRSLHQLREADAQTWVIPRLQGVPKAALVEIQVDEYAYGRVGRLHSDLYAAAMRGAGLDARPGAYVDAVPAASLTATNVASLFGLHRRLRGAAVGYFVAFEGTSSVPNQGYAQAAERLGFGEAAAYFLEHVEADAVHEELAIRHLAASLVEQEPELAADVLFGADVCLAVEEAGGRHLLDAWSADRSALQDLVRTP